MDTELYELANPVSRTAVATLIQLAAAGYEKSGEVLMRLGFHQDEYSWSLGDADNLERICMVANRESRYVALNNVALESGCDIIYDLPCGFIHRAFDMVEKGKTYVGGDLPAVISSIRPVIDDMLDPDQRNRVRFAEVDTTNYSSVVNALEGLNGPICVCTEGLFAYLNDNETKTVIKNIYRLLQKYGGCWITVDPETLARHMAVFTAIAGKQALEILKKEISGFSGESKIDVAGRYTQYLKNNHSTPEEIHNVEEESRSEKDIRENGFLVEKIPFVHGQYDLHSFSFLKDDVIEKLRKALSNVNVWMLTVNPDFVSENPGSPEKNFSLQTKHDGEILSFILTGRMDSLSAPLLLDAWEKESSAGTAKKVLIDCRNLQYVSSAGLRVLMIIKKALPESPLVLTNVNRPVKEILDTTGFIGLFEIHCKDYARNDNYMEEREAEDTYLPWS